MGLKRWRHQKLCRQCNCLLCQEAGAAASSRHQDHALKRPVTHKNINEEEVEEEIEKAKQEKEEKRKEVEKTGIPGRPP